MKHFIILFAFFCAQTSFFSTVLAQENLLQSGPMLGYSTMFEVMLWAQTKSQANVHFEYWEAGNPKNKVKTDVYQTKKDEAFTAHLTTAKLEPGKKYDYALFINGKEVKRSYTLSFQSQKLWKWREDAPNIKFAFGSCLYVNDAPYDRPGREFGQSPTILHKILEQKPDFMLWLGDNTYLREPDWESKTGFFYRYTHTRSIPEMQPLLGSVHHYAIWDDHDFGPNDSNRTFELKKVAKESFKLFWANPSYDVIEKGSICGSFVWADAEFFLLDNRSFRAPEENTDDSMRPMFGKDQLDWLKEALISSKARFKFIVSGGQIINPIAIFSNYAMYPFERASFLSSIANINGVVILSGDRHHSVMHEQKRKNNYALFEITSSSIAAGAFGQNEEFGEGKINVEGTYTVENNFITVELAGNFEERKMIVKCFNKEGKQLWEKAVAANSLE